MNIFEQNFDEMILRESRFQDSEDSDYYSIDNEGPAASMEGEFEDYGKDGLNSFMPGKKKLKRFSRKNSPDGENNRWMKYDEERVLQVYFRDLLTEPLLTANDEKELGAKIKECEKKVKEIQKQLENLPKPVQKKKHISGKDKKKLSAYSKVYSKKANELKAQFIRSNLRLVVSIAKRHLGRGLPLTDLVQEGNLGLIRAVEKFDYTRGFKFSTYAAWWIHQSVTRALAEKTRTIKVPVYVLEQSGKVFRAKYALQDELGRKPLPQEISEKTGLSIEIVNAVLDGNDSVLSLDKPSNEEKTKSYVDLMPDEDSSSQETAIAALRIGELIDDSLSALSAKEEEIIRMRYGIGTQNVFTLDEIGSKFGVTRERIRQIEKAALEKIAKSDNGATLRQYL